ncbi:MAG: HEAT repeat domain-containing protein [candidate division KSB1 bacterium]
MKSGSYYATNAALVLGAGVIGYVSYASATHQMSLNKLILFGCGTAGIASFLCYRIFSRIDTFRGDKPVPRYGKRMRLLSALLLALGLFAAYRFSAQTIQAWQQPALYWRFVENAPPVPNQYEGAWELGNQNYDQTVRVHRIQLRALADIPLTANAPNLEFACEIDSVRLFGRGDQAAHTWSFSAPEYFDIPPLSARRFRLNVELYPRFAIYEMSADYEIFSREDVGAVNTQARNAAVFPHYLMIEANRTELWDFAQLAKHAQYPSVHTREAAIAALGRSRHPQALNKLLELLPLRDLVVQNAACKALAELGDTRATSALIRLAQYEQNPQALRALGALQTKEGVAYLIKVVSNNSEEKEPYWRATAAHVLGEMRAPQAVLALTAVIKENRAPADFTLQREALVALSRIDHKAATAAVVEMANGQLDGEWVRVLLEIMPELEHEKILPLLASWLSNWRGFDLETEELQAMLSYIVTGGHRDLISVLIDVLMREPNPETQYLFVAALSQLAGKDFGQIQYPALNTEAHTLNQRILHSWNNWWGNARREPLYLEQISLPEMANRI